MAQRVLDDLDLPPVVADGQSWQDVARLVIYSWADLVALHPGAVRLIYSDRPVTLKDMRPAELFVTAALAAASLRRWRPSLTGRSCSSSTASCSPSAFAVWVGWEGGGCCPPSSRLRCPACGGDRAVRRPAHLPRDLRQRRQPPDHRDRGAGREPVRGADCPRQTDAYLLNPGAGVAAAPLSSVAERAAATSAQAAATPQKTA